MINKPKIQTVDPRLIGGLTLIFTSLLTYSLYRTYPIRLGWETGYFSNFGMNFWVSIAIIVILLVIINIIIENFSIAMLSAIGLNYIVNIPQIVSYGLIGGDVSGEMKDYSLLNDFGIISPSEPFDYLQWPNHYVYFQELKLILDTNPLTVMRIGYFTYLTIFSISVFYVLYDRSNKQKPFNIFIASTTFFLLVFTWLDNQFVPQFLALILLFYLFGFQLKGANRLISIMLFLSLILAHPFLFSYYILAELLLILIIILRGPFSKTNIEPRLYSEFFYTISKPVKYVKDLKNTINIGKIFNIWRELTLFIVIYLILFISRLGDFIFTLPILLFSDLDPSQASSTYLLRLISLAPGSSEDVYLQTHLVPWFSTIITDGLKILLIMLTGSVALIFIVQRSSNIYDIDIAFLNSGIAFVIGGFFLNIFGARALQIVFLPLSQGVVNNKKKLSIALATILIIISILIIAFPLINYSLEGGGLIKSQSSNMAAKQIAKFDGNPIITPPNSIYPLNSDHFKLNELISLQTNRLNKKSYRYIFTPKSSHYLKYSGSCLSDRFIFNGDKFNDVIYDNDAKILLLPKYQLICHNDRLIVD